MKKITLLAASVAVALAGCGSDSDSGGGAPAPGGVVIKAVDGYLANAEVWVDTNDNLTLDEAGTDADTKLAELTNANGEFTLPDEYKNNAVFIKAIADKTIDTNRGLVSSDFVIAATAGSTVVNPMTNMVVEQMAGDDTMTQEDAEAAVVASVTDSGLTASEELIFGDYVAEQSDDAKALNAIGETLVDHADLPVEKQLELTDAVADEAKLIIDDADQELDDFDPVVVVPADPADPITVTPNNRPVHDQADDRLETKTLDQGGSWTDLNVSAHFSDADTADTLTFELKELTGAENSNLTIDLNSGVITTTDGTGVLNGAGTFHYQIFAQDNHGALSYPLNLTVEVVAPNQAPEEDEAVQAELQEQVYSWTITSQEELTETLTITGLFSDADGDELTYSVRTSLEKGKDNQDSGFTASIDSNDTISFSGKVPHTAEKDMEFLYVYADDGINEEEIVRFLLPEIKEGAITPPPTEDHPLEGKDLFFIETPEDNDIHNYCSSFRFENGVMYFADENSNVDTTKACAPVDTSSSTATYTIDENGIITITEQGYTPMTFEVLNTSGKDGAMRFTVYTEEEAEEAGEPPYTATIEVLESKDSAESRVNMTSKTNYTERVHQSNIWIESADKYVPFMITIQMENDVQDGTGDADVFFDAIGYTATCADLEAIYPSYSRGFTDSYATQCFDGDGVAFDFDYTELFAEGTMFSATLQSTIKEAPSLNFNITFDGDSFEE